jgi:hypothetical protein
MHEPDDTDLQALKKLLTRSRGLEHAPEGLLEKVFDALQAPRRTAESPEPPVSPLRRWLAVLSFDDMGAALSPVRAAGPVARRLVFNAGDLDVALSVTPGRQRGSWRIDGQCLGDDGPGEVRLRCGDQRIEAASSLHWEFSLEPVPAGACELVLRTDRWEITLPPFELPLNG